MSNAIRTPPGCEGILQRLDRYLDNQLSAGEMAEMLVHLDGCPSCAQELKLRRDLQTRLRLAVSGAATAPYLQSKVLATVRSETAARQSWWRRAFLRPEMAVLTVCLVAGTAGYQINHFLSQERYVDMASQRISSVMRVGFGDHLHCGVFGTVPRKAPSLKAVENELLAEYKPLLKTVVDQLPAGFELFTAHNCDYHNRTFQHLAMKRGEQLVSLIITRKQSGDRFDPKEVVGSMVRGGLPVYTSGVDNFQIAAFETTDHIAYVVSDLAKEDNTKLMLALAPSVSGFLTKGS